MIQCNVFPAFDQSGTVVVVGTPVYFTDTSATDGSSIVAWAWDFGDGKTDSGATASHTYDALGAYTITLTITGGCGYTATRTVLDAVTVITGVQTSIDPTTGGTLVYTDTQGNPTTVEVPGAWDDAANTCTPPSTYDRHPDENWLAVPLCHLSEYGMLGVSTHNIYLPLVMRNY